MHVCNFSLFFFFLPVINDMANSVLDGTSWVSEGPAIRVGITLTRSMPFSSANFHAALSASVLDTKYPYNVVTEFPPKLYP